MPRMRILSPAEHAAFDTPPVFTNVERQRFFHMPESLEILLATLRTPVNQGYVRDRCCWRIRSIALIEQRVTCRLSSVVPFPTNPRTVAG